MTKEASEARVAKHHAIQEEINEARRRIDQLIVARDSCLIPGDQFSCENSTGQVELSGNALHRATDGRYFKVLHGFCRSDNLPPVADSYMRMALNMVDFAVDQEGRPWVIYVAIDIQTLPRPIIREPR